MVASRFALKNAARVSVVARQDEKSQYQQPEIIEVPSPSNDTTNKLLLEVLKKLDSIDRHNSYHFNDQTDIRFEHVGYIENALVPAVVGGEALVLQYPVPIGQKLIIESMKFYGIVNNAPVIPWGILADPMEFFGMFAFRVKKNNKEIMFNRIQFFLAGGVQVADVISNYSQNTDLFSDPKMAITIPGGEIFQVFITRLALANPWRPIIGFGTRVQGFLTNSDGGRTESPRI